METEEYKGIVHFNVEKSHKTADGLRNNKGLYEKLKGELGDRLTEVMDRRFKMHVFDGLSFTEISVWELKELGHKVGRAAVAESVNTARWKLFHALKQGRYIEYSIELI